MTAPLPEAVGVEPRRIKLSRAKGWRLPENTVVVSRPGPWGNPFTVTVDGTREEVVRLHRLLLGGYVCLSAKADPDKQSAHLKHAVAHLGDLRGKNLACWCSLAGPCHADTLLELANPEARSLLSEGEGLVHSAFGSVPSRGSEAPATPGEVGP